MKDRRFIELLNLYVDREISPAEAADLEAEVQRSAERRHVFDQYARMDRACTLVLSRGASAPAPKLAAGLADAERKVVDFPERPRGVSKLVVWGGLMAAAAAVAIVFVNRAPAPGDMAIPAPTQVQPRIAVAPVPAPGDTGRDAIVVIPSFGEQPAQPAIAAVRPAYAWMTHMEPARPPLLAEEDPLLKSGAEKPFLSGPTWRLHRENAAFPKAGSTRPPTELNAFELRK